MALACVELGSGASAPLTCDMLVATCVAECTLHALHRVHDYSTTTLYTRAASRERACAARGSAP